MDQAPPAKQSRHKLMDAIIDLGNRAYNPDASDESRARGQREFNNLVQRTKTLPLMAALNILMRPGSVPQWLRAKLVDILTLVPLRPDGVRATLEFVFSVHPSSTVKVSEAAVPQKRGANITQEALKMATQLIAAPPASVTPEKWYTGISSEMLELLDGTDGPELTKVVSYIIGFGILGRKATGAPGTPGWRYLAEPMLTRIKPPPSGLGTNTTGVGEDEVVDLSREKVLVAHNDLVTAIRRLHSLVVSHPNPGLCKRLLSPLLLPLWALSSLHQPSPSLSEAVCTPALELLKIHLRLVSSPDTLLPLVQNLGYVGGWDKHSPEWLYKTTGQGQGQVHIVDAKQLGTSLNGGVPQVMLQEIEERVPRLLELIISAFSDADISTAFVDLLGRWLKSAQKSRPGDIAVRQETVSEPNPMVQISEVKVLQAMMDKFSEKLASQPRHILELASQVLLTSADAPEDDNDMNGVALSLVNMVVTVPGFQKSRLDPQVLGIIESSLDKLSKRDDINISRTANNLGLLLTYRDEIDPDVGSTAAPTSRQIEDRKTYTLARSYITQPDSPPPVRMEGLNLISSLIVSHSPVLDIPGIIVLMSSLMSDAEDYINLQVIKIFTLLASRHPESVTKELIDHFVDPKETESVDSRLRFGEALLQVTERLGETFSGGTAQQVGEALLSVASRRGHRPKTEAKQAREERQRKMRHQEAEDAWEGEVPDLSDETTAEEKARTEILAQIVEGWESKRGAEDVRIRASALSVLGSVMETNIAGLGPSLVSAAVDLCVSTLQLERDPEKGILRRAAILLVMSFVRALDSAKQAGRRLGFGFGLAAQDDVARTLRYVADTDNDGLVQQHARDVVESLDNWQMAGLVPAETPGNHGAGRMKLAGLTVDPDKIASFLSASASFRPRIEEI
ncbi:hypothetical protein B0T24DRAFT_319848 [Lasiosphaeria ovina]|uniref:Protein required for cell viability n=1 Tax=Lasiosphaeria ovina TaxID=92902 RepID=A0AAE0N5E1_9PEZI|nr:hypothetical protein B0T24DRAFT_319848 [Lasiosphaeria ovina]